MRHWRKMTWILWVWAALAAVTIGNLANVHGSAVGRTMAGLMFFADEQFAKTTVELGNLWLWAAGFGVLTAMWFMSRRAAR